MNDGSYSPSAANEPISLQVENADIIERNKRNRGIDNNDNCAPAALRRVLLPIKKPIEFTQQPSGVAVPLCGGHVAFQRL